MGFKDKVGLPTGNLRAGGLRKLSWKEKRKEFTSLGVVCRG